MVGPYYLCVSGGGIWEGRSEEGMGRSKRKERREKDREMCRYGEEGEGGREKGKGK